MDPWVDRGSAPTDGLSAAGDGAAQPAVTGRAPSPTRATADDRPAVARTHPNCGAGTAGV